MRRGVDYYGVLGVGQEATPEELKRSFRQLARRYHPDVAADPESAQRMFMLVVEAYNVLNDPARRRAYDVLLAGGEPLAPPLADPRQRMIDDWFRHAVHAMEQGDLAATAAQCRKILAIAPNYAAASALLGDVYTAREVWDDAVTHYSGAVAAAPRNVVYARKLRTALEAGAAQRTAAERAARAIEQRQRAVAALNARHEWGPYAFCLGGAWVIALLVWGVLTPGAPLGGPLPFPLYLLLAAGGVGLLLGLMLALLGIVTEPGTTLVSVGLGLLAVAFFPASLLAFAIYALVRGRLNPKLLATYGGSVLLAAGLGGLLALAPESSTYHAWLFAIFGGNVIFPLMLIGHKLGSWGLRYTMPEAGGVPDRGSVAV